MTKKKTLAVEINKFLEYWDCKQMASFLRDIIPICELYNVCEEDDWVKDLVGADDVQNVRLIRTVYMISRVAELHSGKLCSVKMNFKNIYLRLEKEGTVEFDRGM